MIAALAAALVAASAGGPLPTPLPFSQRERLLWRTRVSPYLADSLWRESRRYDAAQYLMVPLHAAFTRDFASGERDFADHFARFLAIVPEPDLRPETELAWAQYLYLGSQFLVLAADHDHEALVPPALPARLYDIVTNYWRRAPAWQWGRKPFARGMGQRVQWKLDHPRPPPDTPSYYSAVLGSELLIMAMAADLRHWAILTSAPLANDPLLIEMGRTARKVYSQRVVWVQGDRWLFQPGVWADHPDFAYACRSAKIPGMTPCRLPNVAEDVSHSQGTALWLRSLASPYPAGGPERRYYLRLLAGLEEQFFTAIAVQPDRQLPAWRTRNFMDGRNGIYRWAYRTLGHDQGYGPFEVSTTLLLGWWCFLGGERVRAMYGQIAEQFPLSPALVRLYAGPFPLGHEQEAISAPSFLTDGTAELIALLASRMDPDALPPTALPGRTARRYCWAFDFTRQNVFARGPA